MSLCGRLEGGRARPPTNGQCQLGQIGAAIMAGATAAQRLEEAHASPRHIRNLINEARDTGGWEGFRSVLDDLEPTPPSPQSSKEDDASASDSDIDEEAAAWWRREHGAAAADAPAPAPRNRPAAADHQDDARWEGPTYDGDRQPQRRPPPSSKRKTLYDVLGVSITAPRAEIKKAYRALALRLHPDKCASPTANERFKAVQEAYATLGDRSRRAAYDASL